MSENKIKFPVKLASNNPQSFGIVNATEISGHRSVATLYDLYSISDPILSILKDGSDAIGQEWFVSSENCKYRLDNWENRKTAAGWTKLPRQESASTGGEYNNEALKEMFLRKDIPNSAAELITFLKGIISEDTSYISQLIVGGTSDTVSSGLTEISSEEDTDAVVPSLQETAPEKEVDGSTLGGLTNVNNEVDVQDAQDVFLVKSAGSDKWGKRNVKDFTGKDGVIAYPTMFLNPLTGRLILQVPTNNYENRFAVENGRLILKQ